MTLPFNDRNWPSFEDEQGTELRCKFYISNLYIDIYYPFIYCIINNLSAFKPKFAASEKIKELSKELVMVNVEVC